MPDRADLYRWKSTDLLTVENLNKRFLDINARILGIEIPRASEDEAFAIVLDRVLSRSEAVIANLRDQLVAITQLQWLTATSATPATLAADAELYLVVDEASRELFTPGPFAVVTRAATPDDYAVVRTVAYDRENGQWDIQVEAVEGVAAEHDDWVIAAIAGSTLAQMALLEEGKTVRDATVAAAAGVAGVAAQLAAVEAARDATLAATALALGYRDAAQAARDLALQYRDEAQAFAVSLDPAAIMAAMTAADDQLKTFVIRRARALALAL